MKRSQIKKFPAYMLKDLLKLRNVIKKLTGRHTQKMPAKSPNDSK